MLDPTYEIIETCMNCRHGHTIITEATTRVCMRDGIQPPQCTATMPPEGYAPAFAAWLSARRVVANGLCDLWEAK